MSDAVWNRIGPAAGLVFFPLILVGLSVHGYPAVNPTDAQLSKWLAGVDPSSFKLGIYIEALALVLFLPFIAWLFGRLRQDGRDSSWPNVVMLAAGAMWVTTSLPINESWAGLVDRGRSGLDIGTAQAIVSINQEGYLMTEIVFGLTLLAGGVAILRGGAMSRWAGWAAVAIGIVAIASVPFGTASEGIQLLALAWFLAVGGFYTLRPGNSREQSGSVAQRSMTGGVPATR